MKLLEEEQSLNEELDIEERDIEKQRLSRLAEDRARRVELRAQERERLEKREAEERARLEKTEEEERAQRDEERAIEEQQNARLIKKREINERILEKKKQLSATADCSVDGDDVCSLIERTRIWAETVQDGSSMISIIDTQPKNPDVIVPSGNGLSITLNRGEPCNQSNGDLQSPTNLSRSSEIHHRQRSDKHLSSAAVVGENTSCISLCKTTAVGDGNINFVSSNQTVRDMNIPGAGMSNTEDGVRSLPPGKFNDNTGSRDVSRFQLTSSDQLRPISYGPDYQDAYQPTRSVFNKPVSRYYQPPKPRAELSWFDQKSQ